MTSDHHIEFYKTELKTIQKLWLEFLNKQVNFLIAEHSLFVGRLIEFDLSKEIFVLKVRQDYAPRQNNQYFMGLISPKAFEIGSPDKWRFTYREFRDSRPDGIWGGNIGGDINMLKCTSLKDGFAQFELSVQSRKVANQFKDCIHSLDETFVLITDTDPPLKYINNLYKFVNGNPDQALFKLNYDLDIDGWKPHLVNNEKEVSESLISWTTKSDLILMQGPPGTGKSYNVALYCDKLLKLGKSVCVCTLANKALMELAEQPSLKSSIDLGKVYKTNLSDAENKRLPRLIPFESDLPVSGTLLLATYYKLSDIALDLLEQQERFDVVIIEEASQAFLATIALFSTIANKTIIVGDHKQLPPIVMTSKNKLLRIHEKIEGLINGLSTIATNFEKDSYRLIKTRRLTHKAASQTGVFYDGTLQSISNLNNKSIVDFGLEGYFNSEGGASLIRLPIANKKFSERFVLNFIKKVVNEIHKVGKRSVAVLTQTKRLEVALAMELSGKYESDFEIQISTVQKIQGITEDYAILYLPLKNASYELNENFFNVATSRAKRGTLIITDDSLNLLAGISSRVIDFLEDCEIKNIHA
jgi:DNA replication ATP-dependent helicase Dna2